MKYSGKIIARNGKEVYIRNGLASDGSAVLDNFNLTHAETDYLLSYPEALLQIMCKVQNTV